MTRSWRRLFGIAAVLVRHAAASALGARLERWPRVARRLPAADMPEPERLRAILEELGGTFVKLGQMLALQPDILPVAYCDALFSLLDRVCPVEVAAIEEVLVRELGRSSAELFDAFDRRPLAAASVAQVHTALLGGRKVAVKVQRPDAEDEFRSDLRLMLLGVRLIRLFSLERFYWLIEPLREFAAWTTEELDFRNEARYMEELRANGRKRPCQHVPAVYGELTTRRVLVIEFLDGTTVLNYLRAREKRDEPTLERLTRQGFEVDGFARNLVDNFLDQVFVYGLFHADLHPANLMVMPGNVVGYLDFGITGTLSAYTRKHLVALTLATARGDFEGMERAMFAVSVKDPGGSVEEFGKGLRRVGGSWYHREGTSFRLCRSFTVVMLDMLRLSRETGVWPQRDVIKYIRSSMAIDGLIARFNPEFDLGGYLRVSCIRHLRRHELQSRLTARRLVAWSTAGLRLLLDGAPRAAAWLDRGDGGCSGESSPPPGREARRLEPSAYLGLFVLALCLLIVSGPSAAMGFNLFTAELVLAMAGLVKLLYVIRPAA